MVLANEKIVLSIDAMGGDKAPHMVIKGLKRARKRFPDVQYLVFGDEAKIAPLLRKAKKLQPLVELRHAPDVVSNEDKASQAVRKGRQSSMWLAIQAVKGGEADGVVSAGNTGALMAMAKLQLRTLPGIDRPAIATVMPSLSGECVMLDLGANAECDAKNLVDFAVMGEVYSRTVLGREEPTVGILNIGSEDQKGHEGVRQAAETLRQSHLHLKFHGFVEGNDIGLGSVDVIVTDGFTGNVALKTAEGTAKLVSGFLRDAFSSSLAAKVGYLFARPALERMRKRTDPRRYNGAMFLGLKGICVKSHGGTDAIGFANAVGVAADLVRNGFNDKIVEEFHVLEETEDQAALSQAAAAAVSAGPSPSAEPPAVPAPPQDPVPTV